MQIIQTRRRFLAGLSATAVARSLGPRSSIAAEPPPETTTVRLRRDPSICAAPQYIAAELLRAEGFTDISYVPARSGITFSEMVARGEIDIGIFFVASMLYRLDGGPPLTVLSGLHTGCFELFAHEPIRTVRDLRGKRVGIDVLGSAKHVFLSIIVAHVGLDPQNDIDWVEATAHDPTALFPMDLFVEGRVDALLGFPPEPQELRARNIGHMILNMATDRPWSQYFCCMVAGNREFIRDHPVATKRVLRAILKANDICAAEPERVARLVVDAGIMERYDHALQTLVELPYASWRDFDAEDSMRFFALRLHEVGMIRASPNALIAENTDWSFLNELKRELKA
jgi:NitT/TauT family transport system substrate-binding protein